MKFWAACLLIEKRWQSWKRKFSGGKDWEKKTLTFISASRVCIKLIENGWYNFLWSFSIILYVETTSWWSIVSQASICSQIIETDTYCSSRERIFIQMMEKNKKERSRKKYYGNRVDERKRKRILPQDVNAWVFFDNTFTSLAIVFISSLLLTRPHCWHVNPLSSADSSSKKIWISHKGHLNGETASYFLPESRSKKPLQPSSLHL